MSEKRKNTAIPGLWESFMINFVLILKGADLYAAMVVSIAIYLITPYGYLLEKMETITQSFLAVSGSLLGIVLAGLSIMVAFFDDRYLELLSQVPPGIDRDFFPFWFTALIAVSSITLDFSWIFIERLHSLCFKKFIIWLTIFLFFWTLFATFELVLAVRAHGFLKALFLKKQKMNSQK